MTLLEIEGNQGLLRLWIDPDTDLVRRYEAWAPGRGQLRARGEIEYGIEVPDSLFEFEPPPDAHVVDLRQAPIQKALAAGETMPYHTVRVRRPYQNEGGYDLEGIAIEEDWLLAGVWHRSENDLNQYSLIWRDGTVYETYPGAEPSTFEMDSLPAPRIPGLLSSLTNIDSLDQVCAASVSEDERNGREAIHLSLTRDTRLSAAGRPGRPGPRTQERTEYWFGPVTGVLIERRQYYIIDGEWRWVETVAINYPPSLPDDVFEFTHDWDRPTEPIWDEERRGEYIERLAED